MDKETSLDFKLALAKAVSKHCEGENSHYVVEQIVEVVCAIAILSKLPLPVVIGMVDKSYHTQLPLASGPESNGNILFHNLHEVPEA